MVKHYICDVCGKPFGHCIISYITTNYKPSEFYLKEHQDINDVCTDCYTRICTAVNDEIKKIKTTKASD